MGYLEGSLLSSPRPRAGPDRPTERLVDLTSHYGGIDCFKSVLPLIVKANPHTYIPTRPLPDIMPNTWLSLALAGMERLRSQRGADRIRRVAVLGTGDGLDAAGISRIFATDHIVASDLHPLVLDVARWNIRRYARREAAFEVVESDLFRQYPAGARFDLAYENLPNIPEKREVFEGLLAASCYEAGAYRSDPASDRYRLTLHYNFLLEARDHLTSLGWAVSAIGGRVPYRVLETMFARSGFRPVLINFGLKIQTEAGLVLDGYARAEREGSPDFIYYHPIDACARIVATWRPAADRTSTEAYAEGVNAELARHRVSAREALRLFEKGYDVCHSVYVVAGTPS